eukprot:TRINITY_DN18905_c0_g1_i1.p1 TRINITY_DN18905_c0_g1~~TRINITY_DN18905_c0_g1_i1.p1  ORF type:complete len:278 (+),score=66.95 TRINITY_DN18905_c0_g1_i1:84-917(+)
MSAIDILKGMVRDADRQLRESLDVDKAVELMMKEIVPWMVLMTAAHVALYVVSRVFWPGVKDHWNLADSLFCVPFYTYLAYLAIAASSECVWTLEGRWTEHTATIHFFFELYVARNLFHIPFMFLVDMKPSFRAVMILHHWLSSVCFFGGLYTKRMGCFGVLDGVCEVTSVFLSLIFLFKELHWDKALSFCHTINGLGLWVSYIFTRLLLFPAWLYLYYTDVTTHPSLTWDRANNIERYLYPITNVILLCLSAKWMVPITRGLIKAVKGAKKVTKTE